MFWLALGVTVGVLVMRRLSSAAATLTPRGLGGSLQGLTDDLTKPATIGLNATANVKPMQGASARGGKFKSSSTAANGIDKQNQSGATINITNHYPQAKADSKTRDEVAEGIRLAALI